MCFQVTHLSVSNANILDCTYVIHFQIILANISRFHVGYSTLRTDHRLSVAIFIAIFSFLILFFLYFLLSKSSFVYLLPTLPAVYEDDDSTIFYFSFLSLEPLNQRPFSHLAVREQRFAPIFRTHETRI